MFGDRVGVRGLVLACGLFALTLIAMLSVVLIRVLTDIAIPGWASFITGILLVLAVQLVMSIGVFAFIVMGGRDSASFLPSRDYGYFVKNVTPVWRSASEQ